jgi:hypothetical protein
LNTMYLYAMWGSQKGSHLIFFIFSSVFQSFTDRKCHVHGRTKVEIPTFIGSITWLIGGRWHGMRDA